MPRTKDMSSELIAIICNELDRNSILALHHINRNLRQKSEYNFLKLFSSVKITLCHFSLNAPKDLIKRKEITAKVEHIIVGAETMDLYRTAADQLQGNDADEHKTKFYELFLKDEHMPKLKSIRIEDLSDQNAIFSLGASDMKRLTGIDPVQEIQDPKSVSARGPACANHRYVVAAIFTIIRDLNILDRVLGLDTAIQYDDPFFPIKALPTYICKNHLQRLEVHHCWVMGLLHAANVGCLPGLKALILRNVCAGDILEFSMSTSAPSLTFPQPSNLEIRDCCCVAPMFSIFQNNGKVLRLIKLTEISLSALLWGSTFIEL
ncbi:hypothetical protein P154DRAFT_570299 [Amniculicola lignicola CBS 123094]|uniref:Uncharacterized protein n=1 Tax=Amniculicola lignicola CBS 123094 TaxID=1392246 RepID=A0A6A5WWP7_9PLEO|nr:hypothetical protein P154DRAFT_570299 [Amniculicola lignicola CBS 123094]